MTPVWPSSTPRPRPLRAAEAARRRVAGVANEGSIGTRRKYFEMWRTRVVDPVRGLYGGAPTALR
jgi:hypothetical protein